MGIYCFTYDGTKYIMDAVSIAQEPTSKGCLQFQNETQMLIDIRRILGNVDNESLTNLLWIDENGNTICFLRHANDLDSIQNYQDCYKELIDKWNKLDACERMCTGALTDKTE